jgi:hypothetical protein
MGHKRRSALMLSCRLPLTADMLSSEESASCAIRRREQMQQCEAKITRSPRWQLQADRVER